MQEQKVIIKPKIIKTENILLLAQLHTAVHHVCNTFTGAGAVRTYERTKANLKGPAPAPNTNNSGAQESFQN